MFKPDAAEGAGTCDVAIVGGGISGMATAARLQAAGLRTMVFEAHGLPGGCAGYFRRAGFSFDVGATTLVDFEAEGVGGELMTSIGMPPIERDVLPGYVAWLPDRTVTLHRDHSRWANERLHRLGASTAHRALWDLFDDLAGVFWGASRRGVRLPIRTALDAVRAIRALGVGHVLKARYLTWTVGDALRAHGLDRDLPLRGLLSMLVEDTVHATLDEAPLINGVLGTTIRGAGLTRARGGMFGFWRRFVAHYRSLGGRLRVGTAVTSISGRAGQFRLETRRGLFHARHVISTLPADLTARIGPPEVEEALRPHLRRNDGRRGGAVVMFLGVPEQEVSEQPFTHHQILADYNAALGDGNNMFISVSSPGDLESAPAGHRAVMISTHCELSPWHRLTRENYVARKQWIGNRLLTLARRVYPDLGRAPLVHELATPLTYERYTRRPDGAVGGFRQSLVNANQRSIPHDLGIPGFFQCGDTTWPGLGTVACVIGSRIVADLLLQRVPPQVHVDIPERPAHKILCTPMGGI